MIRPSLLATSAIALTLLNTASAEASTCMSMGIDFTCTAPGSEPVASTDAGAQVTVTGSGSVISTSKSTPAIATSGGAATINNAGLIEQTDMANGAYAITGTGIGLTVNNTGVIASGDHAIEMLSGSGLSLMNAAGAEIRARREAVLSLIGVTGASVVNDGLISSTIGRALQLRGDGASVVNHGELLAGKEVLEGRGNFSLVNTGTIHLNDPTILDEDGVQFASGSVINSGLIEGTDDGIDVDQGLITNEKGGIVRSIALDSASDSNSGIDIDPVFDNGVDPVSPAGPLTIVNKGLIEGPSAIGVDDASVANLVIENSGTLRGFGEFAVRMAPGMGDSTLRLSGDSRIEGSVRFGSGNDLVEIAGLTSGDLIEGLFQGGEGSDTVSLFDTLLSDLTGFKVSGDQVDLSFLSGNDTLSGSFVSFESWIVGGTTYSTAGLSQALLPSAVPVPAGLPLLLTALLGIGALRRKRTR